MMLKSYAEVSLAITIFSMKHEKNWLMCDMTLICLLQCVYMPGITLHFIIQCVGYNTPRFAININY